MVSLVGFLLYILLLIGVIWNVARLWSDPASRSLTRVAFVAIVGFILAAMLFIGVTQ